MPTLAQAVARVNLSATRLQMNTETKEVRSIPRLEAAAKKHGPKCPCEDCSSLHMKRTRDKRMKAMMPGNVDMGQRQPATMGNKVKAGGKGSGRRAEHNIGNIQKRYQEEQEAIKKKVKSNSALMMKKVKAADDFPKKQVPPPKRTAKSQMPSVLMHDKGTILKGKHVGFKKLEKQLSHEKGITDPGGLAYSIGKNKFGKKGMQKKATQ